MDHLLVVGKLKDAGLLQFEAQLLKRLDPKLAIHELKNNPEFPEREGAAWHLRELGEGAFERKLRLPEDADAANAKASLAAGLLRIELPKHERAKPRKIEIKGAE